MNNDEKIAFVAQLIDVLEVYEKMNDIKKVHQDIIKRKAIYRQDIEELKGGK